MADITKTVIFDGEFNRDNIYGLMQQLDTLAENFSMNGLNGKVNLYFSSPGGLYYLLETLLNYLSDYPYELVLCMVGENCSAGAYLPLFTDRQVSIVGEASFLFHLGDRLINSREYLVEKTQISQHILDKDKKGNEMILAKLKEAGLDEELYELVKNGKDVYVDNKTMLNMINTLIEKENFQNEIYDYNELVNEVIERGKQLDLDTEILEGVKNARISIEDK